MSLIAYDTPLSLCKIFEHFEAHCLRLDIFFAYIILFYNYNGHSYLKDTSLFNNIRNATNGYIWIKEAIMLSITTKDKYCFSLEFNTCQNDRTQIFCVNSNNDPFVDIDFNRIFLQDVKNSKLIIYQNIGHCSNIDYSQLNDIITTT